MLGAQRQHEHQYFNRPDARQHLMQGVDGLCHHQRCWPVPCPAGRQQSAASPAVLTGLTGLTPQYRTTTSPSSGVPQVTSGHKQWWFSASGRRRKGSCYITPTVTHGATRRPAGLLVKLTAPDTAADRGEGGGRGGGGVSGLVDLYNVKAGLIQIPAPIVLCLRNQREKSHHQETSGSKTKTKTKRKKRNSRSVFKNCSFRFR